MSAHTEEVTALTMAEVQSALIGLVNDSSQWEERASALAVRNLGASINVASGMGNTAECRRLWVRVAAHTLLQLIAHDHSKVEVPQ